MLLHERLARAAPAGQPEDSRDRRAQGVARSGERRHLRGGAGRRHQPGAAASGSSRCRPNGYQISQTLRESIVFAPHNLIRDAPFTKLDLITCRNLLIYFQPHAQKTVLTLFHFALKPGGFLFLGSSESPGGLLDEFDTIDEHAKVYRKRRDIGLPRDLKLPLPRSGTRAAPVPAPLPRAAASARSCWRSTIGCSIASCRRAFWSTSTASWSTPSAAPRRCSRSRPRRPSQNLLEMLGDDLRTVVSGALHRVRRDARASATRRADAGRPAASRWSPSRSATRTAR